MKFINFLFFKLAFNFLLGAQSTSLDVEHLQPVNVELSSTKFLGKKCIRVVGQKDKQHHYEMAILKHTNFRNGTIDVQLSGNRLPDADTSYRGFIGIAFRVQEFDTLLKYECFYLRPTNGRADDQLRRNHSTQYISEPGYPWYKLRSENPGVYESYTDIEASKWIKIKIKVQDQKAKLYVNGAEQPCLIVNDLKLGITSGYIALWIGVGTEGYFRNLKIKDE